MPYMEYKPMRFRDDIDPETTWVISDTHFGHNETINNFYFRPEDHEQIMIAEWRKAVGPDDTVLHLGDLNYGGNARFKALTSKELTGKRKLLIKGNHDKQRDSFYKNSGFQVVSPFKIAIGRDGELVDTAGIFASGCYPEHTSSVAAIVSFSHYPWNEELEGVQPDNAVRVHGHIHNIGYTRQAYVPFLKNHINMSVEQTRYSPVRLSTLLDAAILGKYDPTTQDQLDEARERKMENLERKGQR